MASKKLNLASRYVELRKEFDGCDFKPNLTNNQMSYLTKEFKVWQLEDKIEAVKSAINQRNIRLKKN